MNKISNIALAVVVATSTMMCAPDKKKEEKIEEIQAVKKGEGVYSFTIHNTYFEVDANNGGRISSYKVDNKEFLSGKSVNADNWGSTFWPSPQSAWGWPPSAELDKLPYESKIEDNSIIFTSKKDPKLGFVFRKEFKANPKDTSVTITYTITNNSDSTRMVAPWEITRVKSGGLTFFPTGDGDKRGDLAPLVKDSLGITWFQWVSETIPADRHGKLFSDGDKGWLAQISGDLAFLKKWEDVKLHKNAPGEGEIEIYANPDKSYVEIEQQGPYDSLAPGASSTWEVKWYLRSIPQDIKTNYPQILDFIKQIGK